MRAILTLAVVVILSSASPATAGVRVAWTQHPSEDLLTAQVLTQDGAGRYQISQADGVVTMTAPVGLGGNQREAFFPSGQTSMQDARVCATWTSEPTTGTQEGVALRIHTTSSGAVRAVTVTKGVWGGIYWVVNVHVWDSGAPEPFRQIGQFDLGPVLIGWLGPQPLPWRICAQVTDLALAWKLWRLDEPEPRWDDRAHGGVVVVPQEYVVPGRAGWYVGHLPAGTTATYGDLGVWGYGS